MNIVSTRGIKVAVETAFRPDLSNINKNILFFNYAIEIENCNSFSVQLLKRNWRIFDSLNVIRNVSGDGVVGEQPVLNPEEVHLYNSGCDLNSEIGQMNGHYDFAKLDKNGQIIDFFKVHVPTIKLEYPYRLN
ncbi:MAG: Co2+/Mg2+ efflux protein ApaG [Bacteroidota bacterium]